MAEKVCVAGFTNSLHHSNWSASHPPPFLPQPSNHRATCRLKNPASVAYHWQQCIQNIFRKHLYKSCTCWKVFNWTHTCSFHLIFTYSLYLLFSPVFHWTPTCYLHQTLSPTAEPNPYLPLVRHPKSMVWIQIKLGKNLDSASEHGDKAKNRMGLRLERVMLKLG